MRVIPVLFIFMLSTAWAIVDTRPLSDIEIWEGADIVAIIEVVEGSYEKKKGLYEKGLYKITARIDSTIKGVTEELLTFQDDYPASSPEKLGGLYLVFLEETDQGFRSMRSENAVIELVLLLPEFTEEEMLRALESLELDVAHTSLHNGLRWIPTSCFQKSYGCEFDAATLRATLSK